MPSARAAQDRPRNPGQAQLTGGRRRADVNPRAGGRRAGWSGESSRGEVLAASGSQDSTHFDGPCATASQASGSSRRAKPDGLPSGSSVPVPERTIAIMFSPQRGLLAFRATSRPRRSPPSRYAFATHSPSGRGRADDCIALTMRKSNRARSTSGAALLLCRASDYSFATHAVTPPEPT